MLFSKPASQLTELAHSSLPAMSNYEQKNLYKEAVCLLCVQIRTQSSKQCTKCQTYIYSEFQIHAL